MTTVIRKLFLRNIQILDYKLTFMASNVRCCNFVAIILFLTLVHKHQIFTNQKQCALFDAEARRRFV